MSSAVERQMETTPNSPSPLLSLPSELRLRILHFLLAGWEIPIDAWTSSIDTTLALRDRHADLRTIAFFHINRQMRREATPLINSCATLCFLPGPRSAWDRRWRTVGRPLPDLLKQNVAYVLVDLLPVGRDHVLFLQDLPRLREVRFVAQLGTVDFWGADEWVKCWKSERELARVRAKELRGEDVEVAFTVGLAEGDEGPSLSPLSVHRFYRFKLGSGVLNRKETRTVVCRCAWGDEVDGTARDNEKRSWVMTLQDLWQIQRGPDFPRETLSED